MNRASGGAVDISIDIAARLRDSQLDPSMLSPETRNQIWEIVNDLAWELGEFIDEVWPVDTGASQADWETTAEGLEWVIRNPREYAAYVYPAGTPESGRDAAEIWKRIGRRADSLLSGVWSRIDSLARDDIAGRPDLSVSPDRTAQFLGLLLPSAQEDSGVVRGSIFAARVAGFVRENTRSRERARLRSR